MLEQQTVLGNMNKGRSAANKGQFAGDVQIRISAFKRGSMKRIAWVILGWIATVTMAQSAGFDCSRSLGISESLVCSDKFISELDDTLSSAYKRALEVTQDKQAFKLAQRAWIRDTRDQCANKKCLRLTYKERIRYLQGVVVSKSPDPLADIEGTYIISSPGCSILNEKGELDSCLPVAVDCLSIKRLSSDTAYISVVSNQTNGHVCSAEGLAKISKPGTLEINKLGNSGGGDISSNPLRLDYFSDPIGLDGPDINCGARASWYNVSFKKTDRKTKQALNCENDNDLDSYLPPKGK